jgi:hypothetical protein
VRTPVTKLRKRKRTVTRDAFAASLAAGAAVVIADIVKDVPRVTRGARGGVPSR